MPFDYEAKVTAVINALKTANTTTAAVDLSSGLTTRIEDDNIKLMDWEVMGVQSLNLPAVFVRLASGDEEYAAMGITGPTGAKKFKTALFHVLGVYRRDGIGSTHEELLTECYRLAENIEGVFQKELTLSSTALWCNPRRTEFSSPYQLDTGSWCKEIFVELEARYLFR